MSIKHRLLLGIAAQERVDNPKALVVAAGTDQHHVTHILWRLQKDGLITFSEGRNSMPTAIQLTPRGEEMLHELTS